MKNLLGTMIREDQKTNSRKLDASESSIHSIRRRRRFSKADLCNDNR